MFWLMVVDVMTTKLQMMLPHVYRMVVDVMTTQDVCYLADVKGDCV